MADPMDRYRKYLDYKLKQQETERSNVAKRQLANIEAESRKYRADREYMTEMLKIQGNQNKERLGIYVDLITQLNKFDEQNPLTDYIVQDPKDYYPSDGKMKQPRMYYKNKDGSLGEEIPQDVAMEILARNKRTLTTRESIATGVKSVDPFGKVQDKENENAKRIKTDRSGNVVIDNKNIKQIQTEIDENPTITMPEEADRKNDTYITPPSAQELQKRTNVTTVSDLIKSQKERGIGGNTNTRIDKNSGGFNAGSSPNQFLGGKAVILR